VACGNATGKELMKIFALSGGSYSLSTQETQTEEYMFPMNEMLKKHISTMLGDKLHKSGDTYNKGSALFTRAAQVLDELEQRFLLEAHNSKIENIRISHGIKVPGQKSYHPILRASKEGK